MTESTDSQINKSTAQQGEVLVKVEGVSKKFCKDLKRSLWYGIRDIASDLFGLKKNQELRKDEFWAVNDVSFELRRGECLGLIGHNGAGKSTLLKMLNGLINPDKGKITMKGRIGALIELGAGFNPILTGRENVFNNGAVLGFTQKEIAAKYKAIVEFAELEEFMDTPVQNYSSGMKVRLGFAVAAQMEPDVLIIDEVLAVGDNQFRVKCINRIFQILKDTAVVFVSHLTQQISRLCNKIILLESGSLVFQGNDIDQGVAKYLILKKTEVDTQFESNGVKILDKNLRVKSKVFCSILLDFGKHECSEFLVEFVVFNLELRPLALITSKEKNKYYVPSSTTNQVIIKSEFINIFSNGKYNVSLRILSFSRNRIFDKYYVFQNVFSFEVENKLTTTNNGILLESSWK